MLTRSRTQLRCQGVAADLPDAESTALVGGSKHQFPFSPIPATKRSRPNDNNESAENNGHTIKKSKSGYCAAMLQLEGLASNGGFKNFQKTGSTVSFLVEGLDGVTIFVEINEEKVKMRTNFIYYREIVHIERDVSFDVDPVIPMLLAFLARAKKVSKKEGLGHAINWDDFRQDVPKPAPPPSVCSIGYLSLPKMQDQSTQSDVAYALQMTNEEVGRHIGNCVKCNNVADRTCERCGDLYCSKECQALDWPVHKRNACFAMPKLV